MPPAPRRIAQHWALCVALVVAALGCGEAAGAADAVDSAAVDTTAVDAAAADTGALAAGDVTGADSPGPDADLPDGGASDAGVPDTADPDAVDFDAVDSDAVGPDVADSADLDAHQDGVNDGLGDALSDASADSGVVDGAAGDGALADGIAADAQTGATTDVAKADVSAGDAGAPDSMGPDSAGPDSMGPDSTGPDSGVPDGGGAPDASPPDAQSGDAPPPPGPKPTVAWVDPTTLPQAQFVDVTASYPVDAKGTWAWCAVAGRLDGDSRDDLLFVSHDAWGKASIHAVLLGGAKPTVAVSKLDTSLLFPDKGCGLVDFDGDDDDDLWVGGSSGMALYQNDGKGGFVDVSAKLLPASNLGSVWTVTPADWDGDGDLDLYVAAGRIPMNGKTVTCAYKDGDLQCVDSQQPQPLPSDQDHLLLQGPGHVFTVAPASWTLSNGEQHAGLSADMDFDGDGDPDLLLGHDFGQQSVWVNTGKGWQQAPNWTGITGFGNAMGWGVADFDRDGVAEIVQTDIGPTQLLERTQIALGLPVFKDVAAARGVAAVTWAGSSWNPLTADLNHDGWLDLYLGMAATGTPQKLLAISNGGSDWGKPMTATDLVFMNQGATGKQGGKTAFKQLRGAVDSCPFPGIVAQSLVDLDNDGDLDVIQVRPACTWPGGKLRVFRNDITKVGQAAWVRLRGPAQNRPAIGARVSASIAGVAHVRRVHGNLGMGSTSTRTLHFGLGSAKQIDSVQVTWPGGKTSKAGPVKAGQTLVIQAP